MSLTVRQGDFTANELRLSQGDKVVPIWMPIGLRKQMSKQFPAVIRPMGRLCRISEVSDGAYEFLNEREAFQVGKVRTTINDGKQFTLSLTAEGNALELQAALLGQDLHDVPAIRQGQTISGAGHIALFKAGQDENVGFSIIVPDCEVKLTSIPGATDGTSTYTIDLVTRSEVYWFAGQIVPIQESWFAGTSPADGTTAITNAAAPSGVITEFTLGTGNGTGVSDAPLAVRFNRDASGADAYILEVRVNGSKTTGYTYNASTGVLTFGTALAAGAHLSVIYAVRTGSRVWDSSVSYGIGEIVQYNSAYYISDAASTSSIPAGTSPWIAYAGFGWDGAAGVGTPVVPYVAPGQTNMFESYNATQVV
jgi:hypothetical protein